MKYAMDCRGYYGGPVRRPLAPLDEPPKTGSRITARGGCTWDGHGLNLRIWTCPAMHETGRKRRVFVFCLYACAGRAALALFRLNRNDFRVI